MSEEKNEVAAESLTKIGGGECSTQDYVDMIGQLTDAYEGLISFTTYVMERVSGSQS